MDTARYRQQLNHSAEHYEQADWLSRKVGEWLIERLDDIKLEPTTILDLGAGCGRFSQALKQRYKHARVIALDLSQARLKQHKEKQTLLRKWRTVCADLHRIPFQQNQFDFVFCNLSLQWCPDYLTAFQEVARVLKPGGLFMFTTLGPDTLIELRQALAKADIQPHLAPFLDMHDVGDQLLQAGFKDPVMDMERLTCRAKHPKQVTQYLKDIGERYWLELSAAVPKQQRKVIFEHYPTKEGAETEYPVSIEALFGHAWGQSLKHNTVNAQGEVTVSLESLKNQLRNA